VTDRIHIGIDFDNTIVSYDKAFHHQALRMGLIKPDLAKNKQVIRDEIRKLAHGNDKWTELQGIVYGTHMDEAEMIDGLDRFLLECRKKGIRVSVISQKTEFPFKGPRVNLREAARKWLEDRQFISRFGLNGSDIHFETTIEEKIRRIGEKKCTHFIDDLPEILLNEQFPPNVQRILLSSTEECPEKGVLCFRDWDMIGRYFFGGAHG